MKRLLVLLALVSLASCGLDRPEVARVGGTDVAPARLQQLVSLQRALAQLSGGACGQPTRGESQESACDRQALSSELLWLGVEDYANAHDLVASDSEVDQIVDQLEAQVGSDALNQALAARDVTREDLHELGRKLLTIRAVRTAVAEDEIGSARLHAMYRDRALEFTTIEADHILVKTQAEAEAVYARVRDATQQAFEAEARRVSTDPGAKDSGGSVGRGVASTFAEPFARAAVALEPGEVSRPVQTQFGWHVIYLISKDVTPFEEAKPTLLDPLADDAFQSWLERRAEDVGVLVSPRYGRFEPRTFSVSAVHSTDPDAPSPSPSP
jgi:parvulin-like peptidyl-prolyl isomerase